MSYGKAQINSSLALHTSAALAIRLSAHRVYQATIFKPISCSQTSLAARYRLLFVSEILLYSLGSLGMQRKTTNHPGRACGHLHTRLGELSAFMLLCDGLINIIVLHCLSIYL